MRARSFIFVALVGCADSSSERSDAGVSADSSTSDGGTSDGGASGVCAGNYDKTCTVVDDCLVVAIGCYCGPQPIVGVSKSAQPSAQACESKAEQTCALGCAKTTGHVGEDGLNDEGTGKNLEGFCDNGQCRTRLMR